MKRLWCLIRGHDWYGVSPCVCGRCYAVHNTGTSDK